MPWIHYHTGNAGRVKVCCVANIPFGDSNTQSFTEIWNGGEINQLREKFSRGEKDSRCAVCARLEEAGGKSIRQETYEKFGVDFQMRENDLPFTFDIRFSNACNFRCRTCWHGASSAWFPEAKQMKRSIGDKALLQNIQNVNRFVEETGDALVNAKEIYFAGGEPLATKEHYLLLEWLVKNKATQVRLRYNTNFSQLKMGKFNVLDYWKHFSEVEVLASIDAQGVLGEYIRKGMDWNRILENRNQIRDLSQVKFTIAPTISVFSIRNLPLLYKECLEQDLIAPDGLYINILDRPLHYNAKALPAGYKEKVRTEYLDFYQWAEKNEIPAQVIEQFRECETCMMAEDLSKQWPRFLAETRELDQLRKEDFMQVLDFG